MPTDMSVPTYNLLCIILYKKIRNHVLCEEVIAMGVTIYPQLEPVMIVTGGLGDGFITLLIVC